MTDHTTIARRTSADEPSIWLGCLACYNSGRLVGHWFSAVGADEVTLADVHAGSRVDFRREGCEEIWGLDVDCIPIDREMSAMEAAQWGEAYKEVGAEQWPALCAWVRTGSYVAQGDTNLPCVGDFEERYAGCWNSFRDYAYDLAEGIDLFNGLDDDHVAVRYFGWDAWISDLAMDYSTESDGHGGVYVFRSL
ncbi:antirestriction protein ArdA [Gordonia sp. 852002-50395_SCH5434458]|uniref:antirestriction protein ArdA n=1 Tax=Gordonia sp. 852002-50395_SCH5434458 TaxID=1834090 RepID=UPI0007E9B6E0|nr:antirestriction protein ArdA [Gordonia sp. 852002-50395_SCH5434458]OBC01754.1 antirestriction protein [Gordonia sp. 852002-50395_SCH5434458]